MKLKSFFIILKVFSNLTPPYVNAKQIYNNTRIASRVALGLPTNSR